MDRPFLAEDAVVLAGASGIRVLGSAGEVQRALEDGFRPAVVVLGAGAGAAAADELARVLGLDPAAPAVPFLSASAEAGRVRLTSVDPLAPPVLPLDQLVLILGVLDDLCGGAGEPG
ncbi:MAG TPA: hypothetical protein VFG59_05850 [Anaeromyxobacter sp.]|nr:hypothetical protein [Anaeromyxobacter sp.]